MGRLARINLWNEKIRIEPLPPENILKMWIGGKGLGVYLALKEIPPRCDPLSPSNKLFILTGPVTGVVGVPESGRWCSVTKSPLTDTIHDSQSGGKFGPMLKFAGFDGIILEETTEKPVYIWIHAGEVEIRERIISGA